MAKILYSFEIIFLGLTLGVTIQALHRNGLLRLPLPIDETRKLLQKIALLGLNPIAIVGAIWIVRIKDPGLIALPFVGFLALLTGGLLALGVAHILKLPPKKKGAIFGCGSFTNIGSIGALVCYVFLGEAGFALVPIYKLFEDVSYYAIGFPIAKYYSGAKENNISMAIRLKGLLKDPFIIAAVSSLIIGSLLNLSGLERPESYGFANSVIVPLFTILLLISIGLSLRFSKIGNYLRESVSVSLIKFILVPSLISALAWTIGFGEMEEALPLKVVIILSSMPVAFNALIPPSIYDLDLDLANSCWFVTTSLLVLVLPLLLLILRHI
jgi:predicted permease